MFTTKFGSCQQTFIIRKNYYPPILNFFLYDLVARFMRTIPTTVGIRKLIVLFLNKFWIEVNAVTAAINEMHILVKCSKYQSDLP